MRRAIPILVLVLLNASAAAGQYAVGTDDIVLIDPARGDRAIPADLYYPADADGPEQPPAAPPPGGFASVAFGHGYQIGAGAYAWIATRLAALGCVVAVPRTGGELFPSHETFALDLAFAVRSLRDAGSDAASPFFGRMGPSILTAGHSMGGGCSFLAAAGDPDVTAVLNFAAAETSPSAVAACAALARPALIFAAAGDCVAPPQDHQLPMYEALNGGWRTLVSVSGASHCQFNAYSLLCDLGEFCSPSIGRQAQQDLVWSLAEPWLRAVLFGEADAVGAFQDLLEAGGGFDFLQADAPTAIGPPGGRPGIRLAAHPNPFNPALVLELTLAESAAPNLRITDARGRRVRSLAGGALPPGTHRLTWDGRDDSGRVLPAGVYLVSLAEATGTPPLRVVLLR